MHYDDDNNYGSGSGRYDRFKYSAQVASSFYGQATTSELVIEQFKNAFTSYCTEKGYAFTWEEIGDRICVETDFGWLIVSLDGTGEPNAINIRSMGSPAMKEIRDSIWNSKTFFGLPVMSVVSADADFANCPMSFVVSVVPRSSVESLLAAEESERDSNRYADERLSRYGLSMAYLDYLINKY